MKEEDATAGEWMTLDLVTEYTGRQRSTIYSWLSRWEVRRETMALTEDVVRAKTTMVGKGRGGGRPLRSGPVQ